MKTVKINTGRSYEVVIDSDYSHFLEKVKSVVNGKIMVVYDENTHILFADTIKKCLAGYKLTEEVLPVGENTKSIAEYSKLIEKLAKKKFTRKDCIMAVGGGVIGDLCGFVASTYMRGITYISCPTTLLSCVDSSVGGKTAVNLPEGKNLLGAFYQPSLVYVSISAMDTLLQRDIECGMGEVVKYAFLDGRITKKDLQNGINEDLIEKCITIKKEIVEKDEFDRGERAKLNLGHTVGHALESLYGYEYSHGLCVFNGIKKIIDLSCEYYGYGEDEKREFESLLKVYPYTEIPEIETSKIMEKIRIDKKADEDDVNLVLIKQIGEVEVCKISLSKLEKMLK